MRELALNGKTYRLPDVQNPFQEAMYIHLTDWKRKNITEEPGYYHYRGQEIPYDAILPESLKKEYRIVYPPILGALLEHHAKFYFKLHQHFNHMASSQAANANLFLPILLHPKANDVLRQLKPDFGELATAELDRGFQLEFWGPKVGAGLLGDHTQRSGTDSDIAIAYYNKKQELCLWLVEHKLTEDEFTECNGFKSRGRKEYHDCSRTFSEILQDKSICYYHDVRNFKYWHITEEHLDFYANHRNFPRCPFQGGTNQLWRNQLLALAIEDDSAQPYKHVFFSVIRHPENSYLDKTINEYEVLVANNPGFSVLTSKNVIYTASAVHDSELDRWVGWYRGLYNI